MNNAERTVLQAQLSAEEQTLKALKKTLESAKKDVEDRIAELNSRTDMQNLQSIIYQKKYQEQLLKQIESAIGDLDSKTYATVADFLTDSYHNGYIGSVYLMQGQTGVPMLVPINEEKVVNAVTTDSKLSRRYYKADPLKGRLAENVASLKQSIRNELSRGIASGKSWLEVASNIAYGMNNPFDVALRDTMRIVRTEGHRINQQAVLDACHTAKDKGADVLKQWDATLDSVTRPWHQEADGQIRELDEDFIVDGEKMKAPSIGGSARNVINCRCQLLQRARWALDEDELKTLQDRVKFYGLDKTDSFEQYKKNFLKLPSEPEQTIAVQMSQYFHDVSSTTTKLKSSMTDADYDEYMKMVQSNPDIAPLYDTADQIGRVTYKKGSGACWGSSRLEYGFPDDSHIKAGMSKYNTLSHEYGHFFDTRQFDGLTFDEYGGLQKIIQSSGSKVASCSDQFLSALRKDAGVLKNNLADVQSFCKSHLYTSTGVQDAVDGLGLGRIYWGHGDKYYNRFYNGRIKDSGGWFDYSKDVKAYYQSLGLDASNQAKVKLIARQYETASELWANIASAVTCGGDELVAMQTYFPEATKAFLEIIGKVVK